MERGVDIEVQFGTILPLSYLHVIVIFQICFLYFVTSHSENTCRKKPESLKNSIDKQVGCYSY